VAAAGAAETRFSSGRLAGVLSYGRARFDGIVCADQFAYKAG
jgi:hypothetical protein